MLFNNDDHARSARGRDIRLDIAIPARMCLTIRSYLVMVCQIFTIWKLKWPQ